jgi:hypothetical protein
LLDHSRHDAIGDVHHAEDVDAEQRSHRVHVDGTDIGNVANAGVVDQHVDAAHLGHAELEDPGVVGIAGDVGLDAMRPFLPGDLVDHLLLAPGKYNVVSSLARMGDDCGADALAAAGDEKSHVLTS